MKLKINKEDALIIVDVQKDFCLGGALPVPKGDAVVPVLNQYIDIFRKIGAPIYATKDWHPPNHASFKERGGKMPAHCIQNSEGAKFHSGLNLSETAVIISKAIDPDKEAYSGFEGTSLKEQLKNRGVTRVFVGGLATDYCVKNTVLDAVKLGFEVVLLEDAIRGVDLKPSDSKKAIKEMVSVDAEKATLRDLLS